MTRIIYKHPVEHLSKPLLIPCTSRAQVVLVALQGGLPHIWIDDDWHPDANRNNRVFIVVGTGHPIPDGSVHCGSYLQGVFVWHVYLLPITVKP